ncbi:hypothetical protein [Sulfuricurvum sp.]|uniref:hypothetical protein n=1 Tax=Sulfuricurvum sp. TaxID=2025608 RepID=UPI0035613245
MDIKRESDGAIMPDINLNSILTLTSTVQGVTEWLIERKTNTGSGYGAYSTLKNYECPSSNVNEIEVYVFSVTDDTIIYPLKNGDKLMYRCTPNGNDAGLGAAWESEEYNVVEAESTSSREDKTHIDLSMIL